MISELWSDLRYRVRALLRRAEVERELDDELRFHVEREAERHILAGVEPNEARRRARLSFGGVEYTRDRSRDVRGTARLEALGQDIRSAARTLRHHRAFSLTVVLTLALGIGANAAIFTLVDALLLRPLPVPHPERLVTIGDPAAVNSRWTGSPTTDFVSYPLYRDVRDDNHVLSGLYANGAGNDPDVTVGPETAAEHPDVRFVSGNFFSVLEVPAYAGRTFTAGEDDPGTPSAVAVISYAYWQRRFATARLTIGSIIRVNSVPITIIGVTPPHFHGDIVGEPTDIWLPISMQPATNPRENLIVTREVSWLVLMGRLAPGVTLQQARAVLPIIEADAVRSHVSGVHLSRFEEDLKSDPIRVEPGERGFSEHREVYGPALVVLMGAVALVILIVCANVANLMLARALARVREMAVRMTLGAGRGRLLQQLLAESALLAVVGAAVGSVAAVWGSHLLLAVVRGDPPVVLDVMPNARVFAFTAASTLACIMLFGLVPAFRVTRGDLATTLRAHGRTLASASARPGRGSIAKLLVIAQIALSTVLLIGCGLLVRSMGRLLHTDLGMDRDHIVVAHVATRRTNYAGSRLLAVKRELLDRVKRIPGVDAASYSEGGPFSGGHSSGHVEVEGFTVQADSEGETRYDYIGPDYFHALGARILRGRDFTRADVDGHAKIASIDETFAKYYFRGKDPIGRSVTLDDESFLIVGVVADVQYQSVRAAPVRRLYLPDADESKRPESFELQLHVRGEPARFVEAVRQALTAADRTIPLEITTVADRVRRSVSRDALLMQVTGFFGTIALILAALGLYGVTAYATTQRTGEFGLRAALGAEPWRVAGLVVGDSLGVALCGVMLGVPIGLLATRLLRGALFGVGAIDPASLSVAIVTLLVTAVVASYLPAWRASKVPPLEALRAGE